MIGKALIGRYPVSLLALTLATGMAHAASEGLAGRCVMDSAYLAKADTLGFRFEGKAKHGTLDLERLAQGTPGVTYENRPYREGPLASLDLPLVEIPDAFGRAVHEDGEGSGANFEVSCFRKDIPAWLGEQVIAGDTPDGARWLGEDEDLGWSLLKEGTRNAWIFVPSEHAFGLPGKIAGFEIRGQLKISTPQPTQVKLPGSVPVAAKRIHVQFNPRKAIRWNCREDSCEAVPVKGDEAAAILKSSARNVFLYWSDAEGWVAEATSLGKDEARGWVFRWFLPSKKDGRP